MENQSSIVEEIERRRPVEDDRLPVLRKPLELRMFLAQIHADRGGIPQHEIAVLNGRHAAIRVERAVGGRIDNAEFPARIDSLDRELSRNTWLAALVKALAGRFRDIDAELARLWKKLNQPVGGTATKPAPGKSAPAGAKAKRPKWKS